MPSMALRTPGGFIPPAWPGGGAYVFPISQDANTTAAKSNNTLSLAPFYLPGTVTILRIGTEVTVVGEAGSKVRLGIYADSSGAPGTLLVDAGQIAGDSATVQEITLGSPLTLTPGWYWTGAVNQSAPTTQPTLRCIARSSAYYVLSAGTGIPAASLSMLGLATGTTVSGALPSPAATTVTAGSVPRIFFKIQ